MTRLSYHRFLAAGGDWGGRVTAALARRHPDRVAGVHSFTLYVDDPREPDTYGTLTEPEQRWVAQTRKFRRVGGGYCFGAVHAPANRRLGAYRLPRRAAHLAAGQVLGVDRPRRRPGRRDGETGGCTR